MELHVNKNWSGVSYLHLKVALLIQVNVVKGSLSKKNHNVIPMSCIFHGTVKL